LREKVVASPPPRDARRSGESSLYYVRLSHPRLHRWFRGWLNPGRYLTALTGTCGRRTIRL
jgi:hypothetical protein